MRHALLPPAALTVGLAMACGAMPQAAPVPEHPDVPASGHLIQTGDGLFDDSGRFVAPLGGKGVARDVHVVAASSDPFVLPGDGVRVAERVRDGLSVKTVAEGTVVRAAGRVAFVERGGAWRVVDADGTTLLEGYRPWDGASMAPEAPPLHLPEYWWSPDAGSLPVPVCKATASGADVRDCAVVHADGRVDGPGLAYVTGFTTGWGRVVQGGDLELRRPDGSDAFTLPEGHEELGLPGEDAHLILRVDAPPSQPPSLVVRAPDGSLTPVQAPPAGEYFVQDDLDVSRCPGPRTACPYRFHEGLAPVWIRQGTAYETAYIGTDGQIAIPPEPCTGRVLSGPFHEGRALRCSGDGYVLIDRTGARLAGPFPGWTPKTSDASPNSYEGGLFFSDGLAAVPTEGGWAYIDRSGAVALPGPYGVARPFRLGMAAVQKGDTVQVIGRDGRRVLAVP